MLPDADKKTEVERIRREFENSRGTHIWQDYVNALRLVSQVVFTRSSGFVLEFIQNAEDAGYGLDSNGEISISVNKKRLKFVHNGRPFDESNLKAICGIRSSKKPERGTLGYLGIGFKSVFKVTDCAEVYSNGFRFKFDRNHHEWNAQTIETPWHVIPIWLDVPSELITEDKTTFVIHFRNEEAHKSLMEGLQAIRAELYLFLKWIKQIEITDETSGSTWSIKDRGCTADGISTLEQAGSLHRFKFFRKEVQVPAAVTSDRLTQEYRANVAKREIAIAFAIDENGDLDPSPATAMYGGVYSFLPLGESKSGAKFPIQADFLVQPGRDSINAEAIWNQWLLGEVASLCQIAIDEFKKNDIWKYQYLAAFEFTRSRGYEAYDKLFGPILIDPVEKLLNDTSSVVTSDNHWAKPLEVVALTESMEAIDGLTALGLLAPDEIASAFSGGSALKVAHAKVVAAVPHKFKKVDRWTFFENDDFFMTRAQSAEAAAWFRALYCWLIKYPFYEEYSRRKKQIKGYHDQEIVLTANQKNLKGGTVSVLELPSNDPFITKLAYELQQQKNMLHPDILAEAVDDKERDMIKRFLYGLVGVQRIDAKTVCEEAILPKLISTAPQPTPSELLDYTKYCFQYLPPALLRGRELWVVTKSGCVRAAREVLFSTEFKPPQNWEINQAYVKGLDFLSPAYISACTQDYEFKAWRDFFRAGSVKEAPDNGVEEFAMNYSLDKLRSLFKKMTDVHSLNLGYDLEAQDAYGEIIHIEVKGQTAEADVELTGNEAKAASKYNNKFYLCVVYSIPEAPVIYLVRDPGRIGERDKLTIRVSDWKSGRTDPF